MSGVRILTWTGRPWEDFALTKECFLAAESLVGEHAPGPVPAGQVTAEFLRLFGRTPRDNELIHAEDHIRNYGLEIVVEPLASPSPAITTKGRRP